LKQYCLKNTIMESIAKSCTNVSAGMVKSEELEWNEVFCQVKEISVESVESVIEKGSVIGEESKLSVIGEESTAWIIGEESKLSVIGEESTGSVVIGELVLKFGKKVYANIKKELDKSDFQYLSVVYHREWNLLLKQYPHVLQGVKDLNPRCRTLEQLYGKLDGHLLSMSKNFYIPQLLNTCLADVSSTTQRNQKIMNLFGSGLCVTGKNKQKHQFFGENHFFLESCGNNFPDWTFGQTADNYKHKVNGKLKYDVVVSQLFLINQILGWIFCKNRKCELTTNFWCFDSSKYQSSRFRILCWHWFDSFIKNSKYDFDLSYLENIENGNFNPVADMRDNSCSSTKKSFATFLEYFKSSDLVGTVMYWSGQHFTLNHYQKKKIEKLRDEVIDLLDKSAGIQKIFSGDFE